MPLLRGPYNARPPAGAAPHSGGRRRKRAGLELLLRNPLFFLIFAVRVSQKFCRATTAFGDNLRDDLFQEKVGKFSAREVSRNARERKMGSMGYAEVMLAFYNKKTRYPLRWAQLHELQSQHTSMIRNTGVDEADELEENASSAHTGSDSM